MINDSVEFFGGETSVKIKFKKNVYLLRLLILKTKYINKFWSNKSKKLNK